MLSRVAIVVLVRYDALGNVSSTLRHIILGELERCLQRHMGDCHAKEDPTVVGVRLGGCPFGPGDRPVCPDHWIIVLPSPHLGDKQLQRADVLTCVSGWRRT